MRFIKLKIYQQYLIVPKLFRDKRGVFNRSYCIEILKKNNINFIAKQGNISENPFKGTLRGFHYQVNEHQEGKTISCISGKIYEVVLELSK